MASEPPSSTAQPVPITTADPLSVNLQIVSPSFGAGSNRPLTFPGLAATTTVRQLKEKIRQALPLKPSDTQQRLIYRGRPLQQDNDTLLNVLGEEVIRSTDQQTVHLVLRELTDAQASVVGTASPLRGQSPAPGSLPGHPAQPHPHAHAHHHHHHHFAAQAPQGGFPRRNPLQPTPNPFPSMTPNPAPIPVFPPNATPEQLQQIALQHQQSVNAWLTHVQRQREAIGRAVVNQNQRERAAMGLHGVGDTGGHTPTGNPGDATRGRDSPGFNAESHTIVREGVMPNGQPYRVTINEGPVTFHQTVTPGAPGGLATGALSAADVHNILRGADAGQATLAMTNAMQRSASGALLANGHVPPTVGVTTPYFPLPTSRPGSGRATPDPSSRAASGGSTSLRVNTIPRQASPRAPEVYILSSPQGPRALLMNNNAETYYTPSMRMPVYPPTAPFTTVRHRRPPHVPWPAENHTPPPAQQEQRQPPQQAQNQPPPAQGEQHRQVQPLIHPQGHPPVAVHPNNPGIGPIVAQIWPHFWLIVRLGVFIWWFTSPNSSWSRWATVIGIAVGIFIMNTGILNGFFDQAVGPVRRHMENLLPLAQPNHVNPAPIPRGDQHPPAEPGNRNIDPARTAARLVAERRHANANWLMSQVRRVERAGLLFLASIAPGVAERHIAHLEAEARAERQRREAEEAAAAAAAEAATAAAAENVPETGAEDQPVTEAPEDTSGDDTVNGQHETREPNEQPRVEGQPLVAL